MVTMDRQDYINKANNLLYQPNLIHTDSMAVMYCRLGRCLGVAAKLGSLASNDLCAWVKGLLEKLITHWGLGSSKKLSLGDLFALFAWLPGWAARGSSANTLGVSADYLGRGAGCLGISTVCLGTACLRANGAISLGVSAIDNCCDLPA